MDYSSIARATQLANELSEWEDLLKQTSGGAHRDSQVSVGFRWDNRFQESIGRNVTLPFGNMVAIAQERIKLIKNEMRGLGIAFPEDPK